MNIDFLIWIEDTYDITIKQLIKNFKKLYSEYETSLKNISPSMKFFVWIDKTYDVTVYGLRDNFKKLSFKYILDTSNSITPDIMNFLNWFNKTYDDVTIDALIDNYDKLNSEFLKYKQSSITSHPYIVKYTDNSYVCIGDTLSLKDKLKSFGCKYIQLKQGSLSGMRGWMFGAKQLQKFIDTFPNIRLNRFVCRSCGKPIDSIECPFCGFSLDYAIVRDMMHDDISWKYQNKQIKFDTDIYPEYDKLTSKEKQELNDFFIKTLKVEGVLQK